MNFSKAFRRSAAVSLLALAAAAQAQVSAPSPGASPATPDAVNAPASPSASATPSAPAGTEEIVVTARRVEENVQKIPLAVTAIGGAQLQRSGVRNIADLSGSVPNLNVHSTSGDVTAVVITIRGQTIGDNILTVDNPVGIYVDGVNVPRIYGLSAALVDVQRIEVLRGPQGTLYGRNTTGGAFSVITKDPTKEFGGSIQLTGGNYDLWGATGILNVPITDDVGLRLVAQHSQHDGYYTSADNRKLLSNNNEYYRAKFKGSTGDFTASVTADYTDIVTSGAAGVLAGLTPATSTQPEGGTLTKETAAQLGLTTQQAIDYLHGLINNTPADASGVTGPTHTHYKGESIEGTLEYKIGDFATLRSITGYRHFMRSSLQDQDGTPINIVTPNQFTHDGFFSQEGQLLGGDRKFNWVVGAFYSHETGYERSVTPIAPIVNKGFIQTADDDVHGKSLAGYVQANWMFAPKWTLTGGFRYTTETKGIVTRNLTTGGCSVPVALRQNAAICQAALSDTYSDPSWLGSIQYEITDNARVYAKASRGFRGGGQNLRGNSAATYVPFAPEFVTEYEVGFKSELLDRRVRLNLAAYYDNYKDVQRNTAIATATGGVATLISNAASARLVGWEGELNVRATDKLTLNGTVGNNNPKYKKFADATGDRTHEPWPAPDWTFSLGGHYIQPTSKGDLVLDLSYNFQSKLDLYPSAKLTNQVTQGAYGLLNGRLGFDLSDYGVEVAVYSRNLLNKHYEAGAVSLESLGFNTYYKGEPRTMGVQLTKKFGAEK